MGMEIERKFLVAGTPWQEFDILGIKYTQGYLSLDPARVVRIRLCEDAQKQSAYITIKSALSALSAAEYEYAIPVDEARVLLDTLAEKPLIEKIRYCVPHINKTWEIDVFSGENAGLVVAEVELEHEDESFEKPAWVTREVTHDVRYKNSALTKNPFSTW